MAVIEREPSQSVFTYEDYMREVDAGIEDPCEYVDGVRVPMTAPDSPHQRFSRRLSTLIDTYIDQHGGDGGAAPLDLMISQEPLKVREPDLYYASEATLDRYGEFPETGSIPFPVDLVIEILSPSERRGNIDGKLHDYASIGVAECWIVNPDAQNVTILTLVDDVYHKTNVFSKGEILVSATLPGLELEIDRLFAPRKPRLSRLDAEAQP
ncbi:MAG: Uma2 family endonuclease [Capsulimonadaceae bacterium]